MPLSDPLPDPLPDLPHAPLAMRGPEIRLALAQIDDLFAAPAVDARRHDLPSLLGEPGLQIVQDRLMARFPRRLRHTQLTLLLPPDQVTPDLAARTAGAIQRTCDLTIRSNQGKLRATLRLDWRAYLGTLAIAVICTAAMHELIRGHWLGVPLFLRGVAAMGFFYIAGVTVWDGLEGLVFDWIPYYSQNRALRHVRRLQVAVVPQAGAREPSQEYSPTSAQRSADGGS